MKTRIVQVVVDSGGGSAAGTITTPPGRYAGAYVRFHPSSIVANLEVTNMGRNLESHTGAGDQFLSELDPAHEKLMNGELVVGVDGGNAGGTASVTLFMHFPT